MPRPVTLAACASFVLLAFTPAVKADLLLGTTVSGSLSVSGGTNILTPASTTIIDPGVEFTASGAPVTVDFTDTDLTINITNLSAIAGLFSENYVFTDTAFSGLSVTTVSDNFPGPGLIPTIQGDILTLNVPTTSNPIGVSTLNAVYQFAPAAAAVPEPSTAVVSMFGAVAFIAYGWSRHRREQRRQAAA
jgi:hypothetical protein